MGNSLSTTTSTNRLTVGTNSNLLAEVGNDVQYDKSMGSSRFLKAIRARHSNGPLVVKTFLKSDPGISLRNLVRRLRAEREALADVPNVLAYQKVIETERAGYLVRQWLASNLYDRISTRPFLTNVEKKWITYQLLYAMRESSNKKVSHGDLKCENILVTSALTVYITDFAASFKPTFLPLDDPADFSFFYDTSGRRTCYVAPERFFENSSEIARKQKQRPTNNQEKKSKADKLIDPKGRKPDPVNATAHDNDVDPYLDMLGLNSKRDVRVLESMDIFSLGCVIAELWRDGSPIFTLSQLFKYREGLFDPESSLNEIKDVGIREMIKGMISVEPKHRGTFADILKFNVENETFPKCFNGFLHEYLMDLQRINKVNEGVGSGNGINNTVTSNAATSNSVVTPSASGKGPDRGLEATGGNTNGQSSPASGHATSLRTESDERIERLYEEWTVVIQNLEGNISVADLYQQSVFNDSGINDFIAGTREESEQFLPVQLCIPGLKSQNLKENSKVVLEDGNALIVLSVILANLRNCKRPSSKLHAMELLLHLSAEFLTDETNLDRVVPFIITLLADESVLVRSSSIRNLTQILLLIKTITPSNSSIIPEYVLPNIIHLRLDSSPVVRTSYALSLVFISQIGERFLQMSQAMGSDGMFLIEQSELGDFLSSPEDIHLSYDSRLKTLQNLVQDQVTKLLTEDSSSSVKRALLENITPLSKFFGLNETNDVLISHMITNLNDKNWLLRADFFDSIVQIALISSKRSLEEYILPLMLQALSDSEEFIILKVIKGLNVLLLNALFERSKILDLLEIMIGYLCHPNFWIRESSTDFVGSSIQYLDEALIWGVLHPSLRPLLKNEISQITQLDLLENLKTPLPRSVFRAAVTWANKSSNNINSKSQSNSTGFWKPPEASKGKEGLGNSLGKEGIGLMVGKKLKDLNRTIVHRSEEDDSHLDKLRSLGMSEDDEVKLVAMRDYIWKLARQAPSRSNAITEATEDSLPNPNPRISSGLEVQTLEGITPQTIFFSTKAPAADPRSFNTMIPEGISFTESLRSQPDGSFSGRMARRRMTGIRLPSEGSVFSPLEELRRRMASSSGASIFRNDHSLDAGDKAVKSEAEDAPKSQIARATSPLSSQGRLGIKAAPVITSQRANATGTMSDLSAKSRSRDAAAAGAGLNSALTSPIHSNSPTVKAEEQHRGFMEDGPSFTSTYDGNDPYIRAHLEAVYLRSYRDRASELGPRIGLGSSSINRRRIGGVHSRSQSYSSRSTSHRRPEGNLIAYFNEHSASITSIAVSPDHLFFVSGSEDGSIKIWDTIHLEKNVTSKSRGSYNGQRGSIVALLCLDHSHCVASCSNDGSLHIWRIEISQSSSSSSIPKYNGKPRLISNFQLSTPGEYATCLIQSSSNSSSSSSSAVNGSNSSLVLGTTHSRITVLDLRTMQVLMTLQNPIYHGSITCLCTDKKKIWLLVGTANGILSLWDLRFHLLLKSWRVGDRNADAIDLEEASPNLNNASRSDEIIKINKLSIHPGKGRGRWVLVAFERLSGNSQDDEKRSRSKSQTLVETWDIDKNICVETFEVGSFPKSDLGRNSRKPAQVELSDAITGNDAPVHGSAQKTKQTARLDLQDKGIVLGGAAAAIERLINIHEAQTKEDTATRQTQEKEPDEQDVSVSIDEDSSTIGFRPSESSTKGSLRSIQSSVSNVKSMYVAIEGYTSSTINSDSVTGGWLDAGKLAQEASNPSTSGTGPAGYMITGGEDRKIRFWDLGKTEKSVCLGLIDEKSEFRTVSSSNSNQSSSRHIHHLHTPSSSKLSQVRSPLLNHKQTQYASSLMKSHKDSITALAVIESPFRCIVAGDASGCIRVWE